MQWYYVVDGVRYGPVTEEELVALVQAGKVKKEDLVCNETLQGAWVEAGAVPHLFGQPPEAPPVVPPASPEPPFPPEPAPAAPPLETPAYGSISVTAPVGPAWERMKAILFAPFDMGKWFALGFAAWLATLGQGGVSFPSNLGDFAEKVGRKGGMNQFGQFLAAHMMPIVGIVVGLIIIGLLIAWVQAGGQFVFLGNVLRNTAEIAQPWRQFRRQGNSLFLWRLVFGVICVLILLASIAVAIWGVVAPCVRAHAFLPATIPVIVGLVIAIQLFALAAGYVLRFLEDFVVPLMYSRNVGAVEAWRLFFEILHGHVWKFILYGVFHFLLSLAAGAIIMLIVALTCCVAGCLLMIPYIGTVALLPMFVFFRLYSLEYLAQYGPEFNLLRNPQARD